MATQVSNLQLTNAQQWSGLTTENNLAFMGALERIKFESLDMISELVYGPEFDKFSNQFPTRTIDDDREFEWYLCGPNIKNYPLVNWYTDQSGTQGSAPGLGGTTFFMVFPVRMFEVTDDIGTDSKEIYQMHVVAEPRQVGTNWEYEVQLNTGNQNLFLPASELVIGRRYAKLFSSTEQTLSLRGGTVQHESYFKMYNRCSMIRTNVDVPGNMITKAVSQGEYAKGLAFKDKESGKIIKYWIDKLSMDLRAQFNRQKSYLQLYSINNKTSQNTYFNKGESGYDRKMGAGLFQQIAPSNVYYNTFWDLDFLQQVAMDLSINKLPQDQRKFVLATGERGMMRFHQIVDAAGLQFSVNNAGNRIFGSGQNLSLGGQYTKFLYLNGIEFTLMHLPILDEQTFNTKIHPLGGLASSYELLIMDVGTTSGKANINKVKINGQDEAWALVPGLRNPFSATGTFTSPNQSATLKDGYTVGGAHWSGMQVVNPTKIARVLNNTLPS